MAGVLGNIRRKPDGGLATRNTVKVKGRQARYRCFTTPPVRHEPVDELGRTQCATAELIGDGVGPAAQQDCCKERPELLKN